MPIISQDLTYHNFADNSHIAGIPHCSDVVTNLPFLLVGLWGVTVTRRADWLWFFVGFMLTAFGSAYYHWEPNNATLVWDRQPMSISFMALLSAICTDYKITAVKLYPAML